MSLSRNPKTKWFDVEGSLAASATVNIVLDTLAGFNASEVHASIVLGTQNKRFSVSLTRLDTDVGHSIHCKIGDPLNISVNSSVISSDVVLSLTNNEALTLTYAIEYLVVRS